MVSYEKRISNLEKRKVSPEKRIRGGKDILRYVSFSL